MHHNAMQANDPEQDLTKPRLSVVVPCRNERAFIADFVACVFSQEEVPGGFELIIADGGSDDGTRELLCELMRSEPRIVVVDNPKRIVSTGLNAAILRARGEIIVRMDVHTRYSSDYLRASLEVLEQTGADNVGGPWQATGTTFMQRAIALAFNSAFAIGGARSRQASYEGPVDTVYLGCWRKDYLLRVGLFDEELVRNQDDELNLRITKLGGRVWQSPRIKSWYYPRSSLRALFLQYMQYGYWKVRVIRKHRMPASIRHLIPAAFVLTIGAFAILSIVFELFRALLVAVVVAYLAACVLAAIEVGRRSPRAILVLPAIFACFHFGYGAGFLAGVWNALRRRREDSAAFGRITR
jgi:succinoglycan biosynthesis protein ExoA